MDSCVDRSTAISTRVRLFRLFLLIPCWESQRLIPKRSAGPRATKIGVVSLKALDHHRPNREEESAILALNYPPPERTVGEARERHPTARFELLRQSRPDQRGGSCGGPNGHFRPVWRNGQCCSSEAGLLGYDERVALICRERCQLAPSSINAAMIAVKKKAEMHPRRPARPLLRIQSISLISPGGRSTRRATGTNCRLPHSQGLHRSRRTRLSALRSGWRAIALPSRGASSTMRLLGDRHDQSGLRRMAERFGDAKMMTPLCNRLTHHCDIVATAGGSWRFKNRA